MVREKVGFEEECGKRLAVGLLGVSIKMGGWRGSSGFLFYEYLYLYECL